MMNRQLQLDAGNTRLKWRLISGGERGEREERGESLRSGYITNDSDWQIILALLIEELINDHGVIEATSISTVSGNTRLELLKRTLTETTATEPFVVKTKKQFSGLTVAYHQVEKLGVDRWLAMLAAHTQTPDTRKIVIDCGTAMTVDVIDHAGQHQGGYIVPGLRLMKESLAVNTADLNKVEQPAQVTALGIMTSDCINHGVLAMAVALINDISARHFGSMVYLTGGDAPALLAHINEGDSVIHIPDLVLDGLTVASGRQ
jgi:type III pantothenate kinase